jgi:flagellar protein FliS
MLMMNRRAVQSYGAVMVESRAADANPAQLVQMLFDGLVESLSAAECHIVQRNVRDKAHHISRALRILLGLRSTLDHERGGDIARNLGELYDYVSRRLLKVNLEDDLGALREVRGLMQDIREAWRMMPSRAQRPAVAAVM